MCGRPLVCWVVDAALRARTLDAVMVATDDERIAAAVKEIGAQAVLTRPDHPSGTDRVAEAARPEDDDIVVNIQGDEPLMDPALIDRLVVCLAADPDLAMATAVCPLKDLPSLEARSVVKVVVDERDRALYFSRLPIPCPRDGDPDLAAGNYLRHLGIYAYRGAFLKRFVRTPPCWTERTESLEQLRALHLGAAVAVVRTPDAGVGVDTPEDVRYVEAQMLERGICGSEA
ncbi:MAG: 3-deoxy-manno-octulosonate cytidylyltransferase [Phycisphaerae bacterium]|nr:3-deoxy-manno-octulosonate cytidylyltransferase [Phycisphaerae bacterium]